MQSVRTTVYFSSQPDPQQLKRLRLRIDRDDLLHAGLAKMKIRGRELSDLPPGIFDLPELEVLDLSPERESCIYYRLPEVPPEISRLHGLRVLMLDTNDLNRVPLELCTLGALEKLSLSNNCLRELPENIGNLGRLESLHLANNRLTRLPKSIVELGALQFLDVGSNYIEALPGDISRMHSLESLIVVFNRLTALPDSLASMTTLHVLWLGYNQLRRLPRQFGKLVNLDWGFRHTTSLAVEGNPLTDPPLEVCLLGVEAIDAYFYTKRAEPSNSRAERRL